MRVPLDFDWELGKVWHGYINPYPSKQCEHCEGEGYNPETKKISDSWYNWAGGYEWVYINENRRYNKNSWANNIDQDDVQALLDSGRLMDFTRVPINEEQVEIVKKKIADGGNSWLPFDNGYIPTAEEVNNWNRTGMGHDGLNRHICVEAKAKRLGVYGHCEYCNGDGYIFENPEIERLHDEWKDFEPPVGEGFQLWETTSEGSPKSPVFKTLEELCEWCEGNATTFASFTSSKEEWMKMLDSDMVYHKESYPNGNNAIFI